MLPIKLQRAQVEELMKDCDAQLKISVDLEKQVITRANGQTISFDVDAFRKHCLLNGLDDIGLTMQRASKITAFEEKRTKVQPWFDNAAQNFVLQNA